MRTLKLEHGELIADDGESYGHAAQMALVIVLDLTPQQRAYAASPARGEYRGFAAIHDFCDANMLLPMADENEGEDAKAFWREFDPINDEAIIAWWNRTMSIVTEILVGMTYSVTYDNPKRILTQHFDNQHQTLGEYANSVDAWRAAYAMKNTTLHAAKTSNGRWFTQLLAFADL